MSKTSKTLQGDGPNPAHESLQDFARRMGQSLEDAYAAWHERSYRSITIEHYIVELGETVRWPLRQHGPGLGLTAQDVRYLARGFK